jgi:hypothetical protein
MNNGSRIVSLPAKEANVRGFSGPSLIIEDEASRVSDDLFLALSLGPTTLAIDMTGCGRPVYDMFVATKMPRMIYGVSITGGGHGES